MVAQSREGAVARDTCLFLEFVQHAAVTMMLDHVLARMQAFVVVHGRRETPMNVLLLLLFSGATASRSFSLVTLILSALFIPD